MNNGIAFLRRVKKPFFVRIEYRLYSAIETFSERLKKSHWSKSKLKIMMEALLLPSLNDNSIGLSFELDSWDKNRKAKVYHRPFYKKDLDNGYSWHWRTEKGIGLTAFILL